MTVVRPILSVLAVALLLAAGCLGPKDPTGPAAEGDAGDPSSTAQAFTLAATGTETLLEAAPDGTLYLTGAKVDPPSGFAGAIYRSADAGATWEDITPEVADVTFPPTSVDPILTVDPDTGRVFFGMMFPPDVCGYLWWSDDRGDTWDASPALCGLHPPFDHPFVTTARPRLLPTVGYPNVVHVCLNEVTDTQCLRSLDGGRTWTPGEPAFLGYDPQADGSLTGWPAGFCGGLAGPVRASPDGVLYLPRDHCLRPALAVSRDDGTTWDAVVVSDLSALSAPDPVVAVGADGTVHYAWLDGRGTLWLATSRDEGRTWADPLAISPEGLTAHRPTLAVAGGRAILGFMGTWDLPLGFGEPEFELQEQDRPDGGVVLSARWDAWTALVDVAAGTVDAEAVPGLGPLVRGLCDARYCSGGVADYNGATVAPDGTGWVSFVDFCPAPCDAPEGTWRDVRNEDPMPIVVVRRPLA